MPTSTTRDMIIEALRDLRRLVAAVGRLREFPESGRVVPERNTPEIREVIVQPYRVVYRRGQESWRSRRSFARRVCFPISRRSAAQQSTAADGDRA